MGRENRSALESSKTTDKRQFGLALEFTLKHCRSFHGEMNRRQTMLIWQEGEKHQAVQVGDGF